MPRWGAYFSSCQKKIALKASAASLYHLFKAYSAKKAEITRNLMYHYSTTNYAQYENVPSKYLLSEWRLYIYSSVKYQSVR